MQLEVLPFIKDLEQGLMAPNKSLLQVIIGPRQVGKTTTILSYLEKHFGPKALYVSADQVFNSNASWLTTQWKQAELESKMLVVDEIQKVEGWSEVIKALWDDAKKRKRPLVCVLLGSSSLEIQKGLSDALTGRFRLIRAHFWNFEESKKGYGLTFEDYLKFGGYPGPYLLRKNLKEWVHFVRNSIINTVVEKDILANRSVKSPALFRQAFEIIISYPAQEISFTKLLGQLQEKGNTDLVKHYLKLYEGVFLIKTLEKFTDKVIKSRTSSPKILTLAPCLFFLSVQDEYTPEERGHAFEALVGAQLVRTQEDLYYWREGNYEIDFVIKRGRALWAIEVKSGRKKNFTGLAEFQKRFPRAKAVLVTMENYFEFEKDPMSFIERVK